MPRSLEHALQFLLINDFHAEFLRLVALGAATFSGEDITCLRGDGAADFASFGFDEFLHCIAVDAEGAGDNEGEAREGTLRGC